mgnify:CR=1 FL=1
MLRKAVWNAEALTGHHDMVEAVGIQALEAHALFQTEPRKQALNRAALAAAEDVVNLRAEAIRPHRKGMCVAPWLIMSLQHQDLAAGLRQQRPDRKPCHARPDDEVVVDGFAGNGGIGRHDSVRTRAGALAQGPPDPGVC